MEKNNNQNISHPVLDGVYSYRNYFKTLVNVQILGAMLVFGIIIQSFISSKIPKPQLAINSYKEAISKGYEEGIKDARADNVRTRSNNLLRHTSWYQYQEETEELKKKIVHEREEYLEQFPENERASKRAMMRKQNIKLPAEKSLETRFTSGVEFYADYLEKQDLKDEKVKLNKAWELGYEYGYAKARSSGFLYSDQEW